MAEFTNISEQTVTSGSNVLFSATPVCSGKCIVHRTGSGLVTLRGLTNQANARFLKDIYQCEYYYKVIEAMKDNDEISTDVRNRMYYHNPEVETVEDVDMIITELFQNCTTDEKLKMKQHLLGTVNKL